MDQRLSSPDAATAIERGPASTSEDVPRLGRPTRLVHWTLAAPFLLLLLTGLTNFVPSVKAIEFAGERLFGWAHVIVGFASLASVVLVVLPMLTRRSARADLSALLDLRLADYLWLQHTVLSLLGSRSVAPPVGKFNAGQKLNAIASMAATAALLGTGLILGINYVTKEVFSARFVSNVFPWHTLIALAFIPLLLGHLFLALVNPSTRESLRGITLGRVRRDWAMRHHDAWAGDLEARSRASAPPGPPGPPRPPRSER